MNNVEIERKYIIELPDVKAMVQMPDYTVSEIEQIYLDSPPHVTHRVRKRAYQGRVVYTETKKIRIDRTSAYEDEHQISEEEYHKLALKRAADSHPLSKTRHTFNYLGQIFEIDIYPDWTRTCIMETELPSRDTMVEMPGLIHVVCEVTGDKKYSNASMSKLFPAEITK